jgi:hypothetical protein
MSPFPTICPFAQPNPKLSAQVTTTPSVMVCTVLLTKSSDVTIITTTMIV